MNDKTLYWRSGKEMVTALAMGILQADQWFPGWKPPEKFQQVLNDYAEHLRPLEDGHGMFQLEDTEKVLHDFVHTHLVCLEWNNIGNPPKIVFTSRYDPPATERGFIDLGALCQNARNYLRREDEAILKTDLAVQKDHPDWPISVPEP